MKRWLFWGSLLLLLGITALVWQLAPRPVSAAPGVTLNLLQIEKPVEDWVVCRDLGVGDVPGLPQPRQRIQLCHDTGWRVNTYCLRPEAPVPLLGTRCQRINENTYWCGNGLQPLREYRIVDQPQPTETPTPTPTETPTPTQNPPTSTPTLVPRQPSPVPTERPAPGGLNYRQWFSQALARLLPPSLQSLVPTPTPFQPLAPTQAAPLLLKRDELALPAAPATMSQPPVLPSVRSRLPGIDLVDGPSRFQLRIDPDSRKLNNGKVIKLDARVGSKCQYSDGTACANAYLNSRGAEITFLTIHSGLGGDAEAFRRALEGTGFDTAGLTLAQVKTRLKSLLGSSVVLVQGDVKLDDLRVLGTSRIPAGQVKDYMDLPISQALQFAAELNPNLSNLANSSKPLLVIETCGWRMPGERHAPGTSDTSASIYLLIIGQ